MEIYKLSILKVYWRGGKLGRYLLYSTYVQTTGSLRYCLFCGIEVSATGIEWIAVSMWLV